MQARKRQARRADCAHRAADWLTAHTAYITRAALGVIFVWFGLLKFCPGLCDVELIAQKTMVLLTFGLIPATACTLFLGTWECAMGLCLLLAPAHTRFGRVVLQITVVLLLAHLAGTFLPLAMFPAETWKHVALAPTLAGQYILKNVVLVASALSVGASTFAVSHTAKAAARGHARPQLVRRSA